MNQQINFVSTDFFKFITFIVIAVISMSDRLNAQGIDPSNTGLGWNISFGERTKDEVRGLLYDLKAKAKNGWLCHWNTASIQVTTAFYGFISGLGYVKDSDPEMFYFSPSGIVGKFLFGAGGPIKLKPYQDLKITGSQSGNFTIRTSNGSLYSWLVQQANYIDRQNFCIFILSMKLSAKSSFFFWIISIFHMFLPTSIQLC